MPSHIQGIHCADSPHMQEGAQRLCQLARLVRLVSLHEAHVGLAYKPVRQPLQHSMAKPLVIPL